MRNKASVEECSSSPLTTHLNFLLSSHHGATDVDPVVFQRVFLVDLFLRRGRVPGGEDIRGNQVLGALTSAPGAQGVKRS